MACAPLNFFKNYSLRIFYLFILVDNLVIYIENEKFKNFTMKIRGVHGSISVEFPIKPPSDSIGSGLRKPHHRRNAWFLLTIHPIFDGWIGWTHRCPCWWWGTTEILRSPSDIVEISEDRMEISSNQQRSC